MTCGNTAANQGHTNILHTKVSSSSNSVDHFILKNNQGFRLQPSLDSPSTPINAANEISNFRPSSNNENLRVSDGDNGETYELTQAISDISPADTHQRLSIHPKHLDGNLFFGGQDLSKFNFPYFSTDDKLRIHSETHRINAEFETDNVEIMNDKVPKEENEKGNDKKPVKGTSTNDTVYTPHQGPWDIPGADVNNIVIKGDWNDGKMSLF